MDKEAVYEFFSKRGIAFEKTEHCAVFNMAEASSVELPYPQREAKNLFVRDDKHCRFYLITVMGDKRVDIKAFRKKYNTRALSFASENELFEILQLKAGSVSPLGLLNDDSKSVCFCLDGKFLESPSIIGVHPNDNTATIWLSAQDLIDVIGEHGNPIIVAEF